ncbi:protein of unknown function [Burkholderia multivorans]
MGKLRLANVMPGRLSVMAPPITDCQLRTSPIEPLTPVAGAHDGGAITLFNAKGYHGCVEYLGF